MTNEAVLKKAREIARLILTVDTNPSLREHKAYATELIAQAFDEYEQKIAELKSQIQKARGGW